MANSNGVITNENNVVVEIILIVIIIIMKINNGNESVNGLKRINVKSWL